MMNQHENYKELILRLARTDFKLRYQGSVLGYVWAILKPLLIFLVLNFVFSSVFNLKNIGTAYYTLELLTGLLLFNFFAEGTIAGMNSLLSKSQLVTKIFVPRWTIVIAATLNSLFVFGTNLFIMTGFYIYYGKVPSIAALGMFLFYIILLYILMVATSLILSPLLVRFRDIGMIWEVLISMLLYASPIIYPLTLLPQHVQTIVLINPLAFIIHFAKQGLIIDHFASFVQIIGITGGCVLLFIAAILLFNKMKDRIAEYV